jgi:hypothetical protein
MCCVLSVFWQVGEGGNTCIALHRFLFVIYLTTLSHRRNVASNERVIDE